MADRFVKGTLILTAAGLMVKILASVNRIFLSRLLGGEESDSINSLIPYIIFLWALSRQVSLPP